MRILRLVAPVLVGTATMLAATVAVAAPAPIGTESANGHDWYFGNAVGTDNGQPSGGSCSATPGLGFADAFSPTGSDAFDYAGMVWVDGTQVADDDGTVDRTTDAGDLVLTADPASLSGLDATMQFRLFSTGDLVRTLVTLTNPTESAIGADVSIAHNFGSDGSTQVIGSSSGDTTFGADDRWLVTSDNPTAGSDPVNTSVFFGPGAVAETPTAVSSTVFSCSGTEGALATFAVSIPAGATRHLAFFNRITGGGGDVQNSDVVADAVDFDVSPASTEPLFAGIASGELGNILNWAPQAQPTTTTTTTSTTTTTAPPAPTAPAVPATPAFTG